LDTFTVAHLSVREYFENKDEYDDIFIHTLATNACIRALTIKTPSENIDLEGFQTYATLYWPSHCSNLGPGGPTSELSDSLMKFVFQGSDASEKFMIWAKRAQVLTSAIERTGALENLWRVTRAPYHPLFLASGFGLTWMLHHLFLQPGFDASQRNDFGDAGGDTGLCLGARFGHSSVVELFLIHGVDVSRCGRYGQSPLHQAINKRHSKIAELLILKGADLGYGCHKGLTPLHQTAKVDLANIALMLLQHGARVDTPDLERWTPLALAAIHGSNKVMRVLLEWNADISMKSYLGRTALSVAGIEVMGTLLDFIEDMHHPLLQDSITTAVCDTRLDVVELLIRRGVDVNNVDSHGKRALDYALEIGNARALEIMTAQNAKPMLKWDLKSPYITRWEKGPWFPQLLEAVSNCSSTALAAPMTLMESTTSVLREELIIVDELSGGSPYVSLSVPGNIASVTKITFTTESHDQGMSAWK
jgi:ankyrin repeat protein